MIRFLLDQNLSPKTTEFLRDLGLEVTDLRQLGKMEASDDDVYDLAASGGHALVTYDLGFARRYLFTVPGDARVNHQGHEGHKECKTSVGGGI